MSYELLTSLYFGAGTNADLTTRTARESIHVQTDVEHLVPGALASGLDVVLTGNPGDGKSHLARTLSDRGELRGAELVLDLSERPTAEVVAMWRACRAGGRRLLLCGNEGPLLELIAALQGEEPTRALAEELRAQVRRLVVDDPRRLPSEPRAVMLIDLADRSVLDKRLIEGVLRKVSTDAFLPPLGPLATDCSVGRNLMMLQFVEVRERLARLLALAGRCGGEHVTFRQLWAAIAFAVSAAKAASTLRNELTRSDDGLWLGPLDNLANPRGKGPLIEATRAFADPAGAPSPELDESIWTTGQPEGGQWLIDAPGIEPPMLLWAKGQHDLALDRQRQIKRLVALAHERGGRLLDELERAASLPSAADDATLRAEVTLGLRRLYLAAREEAAAPPWLAAGVPLWLGFSYENTPVEKRPHVAVRALPVEDFQVRRPVRAPWLGAALGPPLEVAWLHHPRSGVALRVEPSLLAALREAARSSGPVPVPEPAHRFLVRLAGWDESARDRSSSAEEFAVIERPRGAVVAAERVVRSKEGGASYGRAAQG